MPGPAAGAAARASLPITAPAPDSSVVVVLPSRATPEVGYAAGLRAALDTLACAAEIVVVTAAADVVTARQAWPGAEVEAAPGDGYGVALVHGLRRARGEWVLASTPTCATRAARRALWAARARRDRHRLALRRRARRSACPALRVAEPRAQPRVPPRPEPRRHRPVERVPSDPAKTLAAHSTRATTTSCRRCWCAPTPRAGACVEIPLDYGRSHPGARLPRALGASARLLRARSGRCGSCATRSRRPTTTTARTTASSRCSATGSGSATGTSPSSSPDRARCSTSAADRAASSARCRGGSVALDVLRRKLRYARRLRPSARARLRLHAAVAGRDLSVRAVLAGDRARADGLADPRRSLSRARARRPAGARDARLRPLGVGVDREGLRLLRARRLCRRAHRPLHARRS